MGKLERAYITTAGKTFKKVTGKDGNTYHFKDGTPINQNAFNAGQAHKKFDGQKVKVAVPSDKGPGYTRKEVDPITATTVGKNVYNINEHPAEAQDTLTIDGTTYSTEDLANLNQRIQDRHGSDTVFRYR